MKVLLVTLCAFVLVLRANGSIMEFSQLTKSSHSSVNDPKVRYLSAFKDFNSYKIPHQVLDEFTTYVDRLQSDQTVLNPGEDNELTKEIRNELDLIRKAMADEEEEKRVKSGQQVKGIDCGEFGCCADNSKADSRKRKGCAEKLCEDVFKTTCRSFTPKEKAIKCQTKTIRENCPYTCSDGRCLRKSPASPVRTCQQLYPPDMCCWDGTIARGPNNFGCKPCVDRYPHACKIFSMSWKSCKSNSWRMRKFFKDFCPTTCGHCTS
ncbi:uncharacterized protein LOC110235334 [Exaiptasia diaphana]|uniref:ShKT domain-containing protein n=1 Tax=Exaiptasia diaphana TaxID=2652724 RepID=A0A913WZD6_EXADI|nr:uncharacterized protein LOC110235334 [Exaiptasia diaphana]KXJ16606.1 hypothetical protein AC249_AIPGENE2017 [Exaiptasia diaphana]